jgi:hypothetical protein
VVGKTRKIVHSKLLALGLLQEEEKKKKTTSSSSFDIEKIRKGIPTPEEALRFLAGCINRLQGGGLTKLDILQIIRFNPDRTKIHNNTRGIGE